MLIKWFGEFLPRTTTDLCSMRREGEKHLPRHAVWLCASARLGSTADNRAGGWYSYRASKAGVVSVVRTFDLHLRLASADKAIAVAYHPGTVRTGLSEAFWDRTEREGKLFTPEFAAARMMDVVARTEMKDRGLCLDWKGEIIMP
ncbi:hypothetical protein F4775DRAFT_561024 [Biscogniauxia sp. FL1348]|nr:hypothetical protein F4775DRAFT_561024 [Biscogniauxia sp. FL1348]